MTLNKNTFDVMYKTLWSVEAICKVTKTNFFMVGKSLTDLINTGFHVDGEYIELMIDDDVRDALIQYFGILRYEIEELHIESDMPPSIILVNGCVHLYFFEYTMFDITKENKEAARQMNNDRFIFNRTLPIPWRITKFNLTKKTHNCISLFNKRVSMPIDDIFPLKIMRYGNEHCCINIPIPAKSKV